MAAPSKTPEFVYTKTGKLFRSVFNLLAVKTDCTAWFLAPEEEKDLGEAFGDLLLDVGVVDSTIVKSVFACGALVAVGSTKALLYAQYRASLAPRPAPKAGAAPASPSDPIKERATDASVIPDSTSAPKTI